MNSKRNVKAIKKFAPIKAPVKGYKNPRVTNVRRGDIYYADLDYATIGSEQGGTRPVLIIQNDKGNLHSPTVIAAAITSQNKRGLPTHIELKDESYGLSKNSTIMLEQVRTIDKSRLRDKLGHLDKDVMEKVDKAIFISFGIDKSVINDFDSDIVKVDDNADENITNINDDGNIESDANIKIVKTDYNADRVGMRKHRSELTTLTKRKGRRGNSLRV